MRVACVVGARPNFMKMAPVIEALTAAGEHPLVVHTGQHYDRNMSEVFFDQLGMPRPDVDLGVGSDSHAVQTAKVMMAFEGVCEEHRPELMLVGGDVNSTLATALVAAKLLIPVGHVEAGLRSFDRTMPEEINRVLTDHVSELLFTTEAAAAANLAREGIAAERVHFVGNCMVDSLLRHVERARAAAPWAAFDLEPQGYGLLTLHRPSNVDDLDLLADLLETIDQAAERLPVVFPIHPRTATRLASAGLEFSSAVHECEPVPYLDFLGLMAGARFVMTDSGGIQEETTVLDIPCLTLRWNTERPVTTELGSNRLVGTERGAIVGAVDEILAGKWKHAQRPPLWDGRAADRIVAAIGRWSENAPPWEHLPGTTGVQG
jgi:UDP-N-acetylglucosamine 2-epimerase (non-hydrolysing)